MSDVNIMGNATVGGVVTAHGGAVVDEESTVVINGVDVGAKLAELEQRIEDLEGP
jgi:hypothetical protein